MFGHSVNVKLTEMTKLIFVNNWETKLNQKIIKGPK